MNTASVQLQHVSRLVDSIEDEMRQLALWDEEPPTSADMASRMPFCYDTLKLWQWLQWILVPRIRMILDDGGVLPENCDIAPLAEVEFRRLPRNTQRLLDLVRELDRVVSQ